jgi:uncharacterized protein YbcC (UPF0753/DUF2309 family)
MNTLEEKIMVIPNESERIELRSLVNLAAEPISHYWPMKTFIHHNPLHGLEGLSFEKAIDEANRFFGGHGYLPNEEHRKFYNRDRISDESIKESLSEVSQNTMITIGKRELSHQEVLRAILINGTGKIDTDVSSAILNSSLNKPGVRNLVDKLKDLSKKIERKNSLKRHGELEREELATQYTIGEWCDQSLGTTVQDQINGEIIKWCGGFLDEGHAPWSMPSRDKTFYGVWKELAKDDRSGPLLGIQDWEAKIQNLPDRPEDAILESLAMLAIPKHLWFDYFTLQLAQLSGWAGFIKWRSEQKDYEWQEAYSLDLIKYMAIRLFYEREFVELACQDKLAIPGTYDSIRAYLNDYPFGYGLYKENKTRGLPDELIDRMDMSLFVQYPLNIDDLVRYGSGLSSRWERIREEQETDSQTLMVLHLAKKLNLSIQDILKSDLDTIGTLLDWVEQFPEADHGPIWLKAFEATYLKSFVKQISPSLKNLAKSDASDDPHAESRPLSQAVFCIDVRSEPFRRHFEETGGNETFGFAGFFGVPLCYQGFSREDQTDQCPVLLKPVHVVKEVPRSYQVKAAEKFLERQQLAKTGHTLLHDLKENVVTPYVMVEAIGWFFGFKLFGQTLNAKWFHNVISWVKERLTVPIGTALTVDKIFPEEAHEMAATKHRGAIYRLLTDRYGKRGSAVPHDQIERIRKLALEQIQPDDNDNEEIFRLLGWRRPDLENFVQLLRKDFNVNLRDVDRSMQRITQAGFTDAEQVHFVETALRLTGITKIFSRLVLFCAHGSTSDNNPYESALDCGACGGNHGISNARALAVMANKQQVRQALAERGILIPPDTHFLPGQHDTTTDEVKLFDLEEVPATHRKDLVRLQQDLHNAGEKNSRERLARFPDEPVSEEIVTNGVYPALKQTKQRSVDWSQVRPEWGLSGHTAFIVGRRILTQEINLEGRTFLHSYDCSIDPDGKYLEIIMTAPMIVANWINMEHYFSTVDPEVYGSGSKVYHNVVGRLGVMFGSQSDLCVGLPIQTVFDGEEPYHEPMRLFTVIEAPLNIIENIIGRHNLLQRLTRNEWIHIVAIDPDTKDLFLFQSPNNWQPIN